MITKQLQFEQRLHMLARKHQAMSHGYVTRVQPDGLIVAQPKRSTSRLPRKSIILFLVAFIGFKAFLIATLGPLAYEDRLNWLSEGTMVERGGAFVMLADPLSMYVANQVGPILR